MALFDFLKCLTASDRRELEAKYAQMVTVNELKEQVKELQKAIAAIKPVDLSGYAKVKDIPKQQDLSGYAKKGDIPKSPDMSLYVSKKELSETAKYWLDSNTKKKFTLYTGEVKTFDPKKTSVDQLTILI